jgi:hypothetical protein
MNISVATAFVFCHVTQAHAPHAGRPSRHGEVSDARRNSVFSLYSHCRGTECRPRLMWWLRTELWAPPFSLSMALGPTLTSSISTGVLAVFRAFHQCIGGSGAPAGYPTVYLIYRGVIVYWCSNTTGSE